MKIVFTFMQEVWEEYPDLVTNVFDSEEELLDKWLENFMSYGLKDPDTDEVMNEDTVKDVLLGKWNGERIEADGLASYTFSVVKVV